MKQFSQNAFGLIKRNNIAISACALHFAVPMSYSPASQSMHHLYLSVFFCVYFSGILFVFVSVLLRVFFWYFDTQMFNFRKAGKIYGTDGNSNMSWIHLKWETTKKHLCAKNFLALFDQRKSRSEPKRHRILKVQKTERRRRRRVCQS